MSQSQIFDKLKLFEGEQFSVLEIAKMLYGKNFTITNINTTCSGLRRLCKGKYGVRRLVNDRIGSKGSKPILYCYKKIYDPIMDGECKNGTDRG